MTSDLLPVSDSWLEGLLPPMPRSREAYIAEWTALARWLEAEGPEEVARLLIEAGALEANRAIAEYRDHLISLGRAPATVNRALAAIRSVFRAGHRLGAIPFQIVTQGPKNAPVRPTGGPDQGEMAELRAYLAQRPDGFAARRDAVIVAILYDLGARLGELLALQISDLDVAEARGGPRLMLHKKGLIVPVETPVAPQTHEVIVRWLEVRGMEPGPLVWWRPDEKRLPRRNVARLLHQLERDAGIGPLRPHGLRHAAITRALDLTGGDVRAVCAFARHADVRTTMVYDDRRRDEAGRVGRLVAADAAAPRDAAGKESDGKDEEP